MIRVLDHYLGDCWTESNYAGSKNVQNFLGSNFDLIVARIERSANFIHFIPLP